jgi:hypothetical protein
MNDDKTKQIYQLIIQRSKEGFNKDINRRMDEHSRNRRLYNKKAETREIHSYSRQHLIK